MITTCASGQQGHPPYGPCIARMSLCGGHAPHAGQEGNGRAEIPQRRVPLWPGTPRRGQIATRRSRCSVPMLLMARCAEKQPATPSLRAHPPPPPQRSTTRPASSSSATHSSTPALTTARHGLPTTTTPKSPNPPPPPKQPAPPHVPPPLAAPTATNQRGGNATGPEPSPSRTALASWTGRKEGGEKKAQSFLYLHLTWLFLHRQTSE